MSAISPCTNVCRLNRHGYCVGCRRHIDEIGRWSALSDAQARAQIALLAKRDIDNPRAAPKVNAS